MGLGGCRDIVVQFGHHLFQGVQAGWNAPDQHIPRLLDLVALTDDSQIAVLVEQLLDHQNHDIRLKAIATLGRIQADRAVPRLADILFKKSWLKGKKLKTLQETAATALARIKSDGALKALQRAANEGSAEIQALSKKMLEGL